MENRRLQRVLGGRARARGSGGKALKVTVVFLVILFILTQLAFMSSTSDEKDATDLIHSSWVLAILIIATTVVCGVTVYSCYQTPEHVTGKLALAVLYLAMMWYLWVFDYQARRPSLFSDLTSGETTVIGWFLALEFIIFVAYVITHWFYPFIVSKLELWPTGAKLWFRFRQVESPHRDSVKFSYRPSGIFGMDIRMGMGCGPTIRTMENASWVDGDTECLSDRSHPENEATLSPSCFNPKRY
ncbi:hypothetical protein Pmar_PMAR017719 [Perkinsus marinus ATCC 50983]|uniref:Transmembrane protein n=1 Tax=Perkinsus marinus (strain ATCC 50983 / TXsc) TaxID=423536 RepID=C5L3T2_PERM5|nr:hypothetical protein Pmar_PMAR017719 [Perkinsus marinus ATCC 50983]EER08661.1 hypothetical protein Pmar_PMAR017719 [Perkinsus marinus ATCC 50983]|eukprot:XP_002776845.1 hypothetical protein Pmar_PMAR017719 [Perkinsus marinus ATCC 50983]